MIYFIVGFVVLVYAVIMIFRVIRFAIYTYKASLRTKPFNREIKNAYQHILLLGDSSVYGPGVLNPKNTIGGLFSKKFPKATIETLAVNGSKVKDLEKQLRGKKYKKYTIILIGIGANDIVQFSNFNSLRTNLTIFLKKVNTLGEKIILCHSINIGNVGFYMFPFDYLFDYRTRKLSLIYTEIAKRFPKLIYVNFYRPKKRDYYNRTTRKKFLAGDGVHPNDYATQFFFNIIWKELQKLQNKNLMKSS